MSGKKTDAYARNGSSGSDWRRREVEGLRTICETEWTRIVGWQATQKPDGRHFFAVVFETRAGRFGITGKDQMKRDGYDTFSLYLFDPDGGKDQGYPAVFAGGSGPLYIDLTEKWRDSPTSKLFTVPRKVTFYTSREYDEVDLTNECMLDRCAAVEFSALDGDPTACLLIEGSAYSVDIFAADDCSARLADGDDLLPFKPKNLGN